MLNQARKHPLVNVLSFFLLIFFSSLLSLTPQYINGQGLVTCNVPYSNELYGITMNYPSEFLSTGPDLSQANAFIASFTNRYGAGSVFLDVKSTTDTLEEYAFKRHLSDLSLDPRSVDVIEPTRVTLAGNNAVQYEYTYTGSDQQSWASYVVLMKHPYNGQIYEFNLVAPVNNFQGFLDDIQCMTKSFQVR